MGCVPILNYLIKRNIRRRGNSMRDPHVESLRYRLKTSATTTYKNPPAVKVIRDEFECHLNDGVLTCRIREHYPAVEEARRVVEGFLSSWEIKTALELGRDEMRFQFEDSHVIDRNPPPPGSPKNIQLSGTVVMTSNTSAILHVTRRKYPDPPTVFTVTPDVETLWQRYNNYLDGKEPLSSMAYFCLTVVQNKADGRKSRKSAAKLFSIQKTILCKLGNLTSNKGDAETVRKAPEKGSITALSEKEKKWIEAVVKILIRRTGELANIQSVRRITMTDLPKI